MPVGCCVHLHHAFKVDLIGKRAHLQPQCPVAKVSLQPLLIGCLKLMPGFCIKGVPTATVACPTPLHDVKLCRLAH